MNKQKFDSAIENYINGNLKDFRKFLKGLTKVNLIYFLCYCDENYPKINIDNICTYL